MENLANAIYLEIEFVRYLAQSWGGIGNHRPSWYRAMRFERLHPAFDKAA